MFEECISQIKELCMCIETDNRMENQLQSVMLIQGYAHVAKENVVEVIEQKKEE